MVRHFPLLEMPILEVAAAQSCWIMWSASATSRPSHTVHKILLETTNVGRTKTPVSSPPPHFDLLHWLLEQTALYFFFCFAGPLGKLKITISPAPNVNLGVRVEITCSLVSTEHLDGTFFLQKVDSTFNMEKNAENQAATFVFPAVDVRQQGSYFCEYEKKLPDNVINYPQGVLAKLSGTGFTHGLKYKK